MTARPWRAPTFIRAINDKLERPNEIWRDLPRAAFISRRRRRRPPRRPRADAGDQSAAEFGSVAMTTGRRLAAADARLRPPLLRMLPTVTPMEERRKNRAIDDGRMLCTTAA